MLLAFDHQYPGRGIGVDLELLIAHGSDAAQHDVVFERHHRALLGGGRGPQAQGDDCRHDVS